MVEVQSVTKRYGALTALAGIDLEVRPGEIVGFLGPNGAGKTTAIQIMLGLKTPTSGSARLFGLPPRHPEARARVGVMLQESGVPGSLSVQELVRLFQSYYPHTLPTEELLARAGLLDKRRSLVATLSGGQKQRLYFALALAGDPDLIFLDEPTVAMDALSRRAFWEQVRELAALGKTVLFSTHYLDEADALASRIVVIHEGRVLAEGSPKTIKGLVADKTVRFRSPLAPDALRALPGVQRAEADHGYLVAYTAEPERLLAWLFAEGHALEDLTVQDTDLETAFISLTGTRKGEA